LILQIPGGQIGIAFSGDYPGNFAKHTFYVRITFRDRCAFPFPGAFIIAGAQACPATASAVAWTMYQKYANGLPLYRQEKDWRQYGAQISRTTLAN